jgi:hypothetical protein
MTGNTVEDLQKLVVRFNPKSEFWFSKDAGGTDDVIRSLCLPEDFWQRDSLDHIRRAAWHHVLPPDSVFNAALTKLSACIPPTVPIDTGVLNPVPLHHNGSIAGPSGAGKSSMCDVGAECVELRHSGFGFGEWEQRGILLPNGIHTVENDFGVIPYRLPLGTGAGLCEAYYGQAYYGDPDKNGNRKSRRQQIRTNVMLFSDEGHDFVKSCRDPKSNIGEVTRTMWAGRLSGQGNASTETRRILPKGSYTLSVLVGFVEEVLAEFLCDEEQQKGTPQRFVHTWSVSPDIPGRKPDAPGVLRVRVPTTNLTVCPVLAQRLEESQRARARGEVCPPLLESQRPSVTVRVAGLLAVLERRTEINEQDWRLAEMMFENSLRIAEHCLAKLITAAASRKDKRRLDDLSAAIVETELMGSPEGKVGIRILSLLAEHPGEWVKWSGVDGIRTARLKGDQRSDGLADKALLLLRDEKGLVKEKTEGRTSWLMRMPS